MSAFSSASEDRLDEPSAGASLPERDEVAPSLPKDPDPVAEPLAPGEEDPAARDPAFGDPAFGDPAFGDFAAPDPEQGSLEARDELSRVAAEREEYLEALRRLQAEFDNFRKRTARQQGELVERATEGLLERLLPVLDAFDLALAHGASEGVTDEGGAFAQIASLLRDQLAKDGLERIDSVGVAFDPSIHDAVAHLEPPEARGSPPSGREGDYHELTEEQATSGATVEEDPGEESLSGELPTRQAGRPEVAEVLRAGYRLKGRVLRPAMVTVQG